MSRIITRLLALFLLCLFHPDSAGAQQGGRPLNLKLGDAVVTGFSGTLPSDPAQPGARNTAPNDSTFINPDGPSVRVLDVSRPGYVWDGRLFAAPKTFDVFAKDVGQVFGVALDDSAQPNIYVAATSMFGLNIVVRGRDGLPERKRKGAPGAGWMKGQFGLDLQGGPGSIYKIDGRTGVPTLFANVTLNGVPNPGPGLGNLAYDSAHKQLFVSDLHTGMIHRFALDGKELGVFDHGISGLGAAQVAFNPANRPNIASERFDSEKPDSWGFAPVARRVWGLAVHEGRLYYSVVSGPQIWSVGIERDGSFAADPRWELDVPAQAGRLPISDIAFSQQGAMILAQRALILGAYDYSAFSMPGEPQVFRVWLKGPNDPPSPGRWKLTPEEYAVGYAGNYRNTNGGVALGYGYGKDGTLQPGSCEASLWTTGQNLRNNPALRSQLEPGGPLLVHGLQGSPIDMVRGANEPPATSYFVDYDDTFVDPSASGHMGSVRIYSQPCAPATVRPVAASPAGGGGGGGDSPPPPPNACYCPATPIPASGPSNYITNGNFATGTLAGWTQGGTFMTYPVSFTAWSGFIGSDPLTLHSPLVPLAAGGAAYFVDDRAVNQSLSQSVTLPAGNYEVGFDLYVPYNGAANPNDATMSVVIAGVTVLPTVSASSIISAQTVNGEYGFKEATWVHYSAFFSTCGGTYTANFNFNSFGGPASGGIANAAKDFVVDRVYIIDSTTGGTNISCTGSVNVKKEVTTHDTLIPWPNPGPLFPMTLTCTAPPQSWSFSLNNNGTYTANNIPFGKTCTVAEGPMPPFPPNLCPRGTVPAWLPLPFTTPASVVINGTTVTMVVHNSVTCVKPIDVGIVKTGGTTPYCPAPYYYFSIKVTNGPTPWPGTGNVVVTDTVPANIQFGPISAPGWTCPLGIIPPGTTFTCTYTGPALTANQVLPLIGIPATPTVGAPFPPYTNTASVSIPSSSGYVDTNPTNNSSTVTVSKPAGCGPSVTTCQAPLVPGAIPGQCICGPDTQLVGTECVKKTTCEAPKVPGPDGQCICGPGYTLRGKECVKQPACEAPKVPGPAGQCICGPGYMPRGKGCVKETACISPAKSNGRGGCDCPEGWSKQGSNKCVKRERKGVKTDDVRRGIDIIRGIPGSSGGGRDRGGRDSPSPGTR